MSRPRHHVIIGTGVAGNQATRTLRQREPGARISLLTLSALPFYNRYDLPRVFRGVHDWREFLVDPPSFYQDQRIELRRCTQVVNVDAQHKTIALEHNETLSYDTLLVASGGRPYLPEELSEYRDLLDGFSSFEQAMAMQSKLPPGGTVAHPGRRHDRAGPGAHAGRYRAPRRAGCRQAHLLAARRNTRAAQRAAGRAGAHGYRYHRGRCPRGHRVYSGRARGFAARRIVFGKGRECTADVVLPSFGLAPSVEFMIGSGVAIERGLLVSPTLRTTDESIMAAGDVCQIWSDADNRYRFYFGWKNVRAMGELAARNLTGDDEAFVPAQDETLHIHDGITIHSPFWEYA